MRKTLFGLGLFAVTTLIGARAVPADSREDAITTQVRINLLTTNGVSGTRIKVDTSGRKVTLEGKVPTAAEKTQAESVARKTAGVEEVKNLLDVAPEERKEAVKASDLDIQQGVTSALQKDKSTRNVRVASVNRGVVRLSGKTTDLEAELKAIEKTAAVPGVRRVETKIEATDK